MNKGERSTGDTRILSQSQRLSQLHQRLRRDKQRADSVASIARVRFDVNAQLFSAEASHINLSSSAQQYNRSE